MNKAKVRHCVYYTDQTGTSCIPSVGYGSWCHSSGVCLENLGLVIKRQTRFFSVYIFSVTLENIGNDSYSKLWLVQ